MEDARLFAEVLQRVRENYVDAVDDHKLMQAAIRGMVEALDSHSTLLSTDEFEDMQVSTSGAYAGIGVEVAPAKDGVSVVRRMANSPAERAGIQRRRHDRQDRRRERQTRRRGRRDRAHARSRGQYDPSGRAARRRRSRRSSSPSSARTCSCRASSRSC